jgi:hypothetical protein
MPIDVLEVSDDEDNRFTPGKLTDKLLHTGKVCPEFVSTLIDGFGSLSLLKSSFSAWVRWIHWFHIASWSPLRGSSNTLLSAQRRLHALCGNKCNQRGSSHLPEDGI